MTPVVPLDADPSSAEESRNQDWLALHIYYTRDRDILLGECVAPLVRELKQRGLLSQYFFVRHWLEGRHVRLRLKPKSEANWSEVRRLAEDATDEFLARKPSVFDPVEDLTAEQYKQRFLLEFSQEQWDARYGPHGWMPRRDDNTREYMEYIPEYDRYGGAVGVAIAESHFEKSSDIILGLCERRNVRVRSVRLGVAAQLMAVMYFSFLDSQEQVAKSLQDYLSSWHWWFASQYERYNRAYDKMASSFHARISEIYGSVAGETSHVLGGFVGEWATHCSQLRRQVTEELAHGSLVLRKPGPSGEMEAVADREKAITALLRSYMHMTNNRLGGTIGDENYLTYALRQAILGGLTPQP